MAATAAAIDGAIGTAAAARLLGVSEGRVRQLADSGALPSVKTALGRLFEPEDVATLIAARERRAVTIP
jgi:excisionase family DNA binding protein